MALEGRRHGSVDGETLDYIRERDGGICVYCEDAIGQEADHVLPIKRGGKNLRGNLVWACKHCNRKKKHHLIETMIAKAFKHLLSVGESLDWVDAITRENDE